jgi:flavin-dependent dehydrogenase
MVEFFLDKSTLPGYAWIFPTGKGRANVGIGMRLDHFRRLGGDLENLLDRFMAKMAAHKRSGPHLKIHDVATWQLNFGSQKALRRAYPGALLVGDAGGMINPLTGGGIGNAVLAALLAAQLIHRALNELPALDGTLAHFDRLCDEELGDQMRHSYFLQRALLSVPWWVDALVRLGRANNRLAQTFIGKL